jgi:hypothetical protein
MSSYYPTEDDLPKLIDNIFIYYFIISVESCDKNVDVVLSDPNFYFYKNEEQKPQEYISINEIRSRIKPEFDNTVVKEHPHFSPVDYIVIEKYSNETVAKTKDAKTKDANTEDRYFLMKTRDFENTFCYVEKIKTTLRTNDVVDIMSILIISKDKSKKSGGTLYTDVNVNYNDNQTVYYIQYQLLQRLGLETYNTIATMIQNDNTLFTTKYKNKEGINKELFNNNTITTRFTKICHSDTDQYVAHLHKTLKEQIITEDLMTEIYTEITQYKAQKKQVFESVNEKALIITYIQLLIEKWIDLYITIELNKELYVSNKSNNTASDNSTKIDEVNNYMIKKSSCKIDIIKYQLSLLHSVSSLKPDPTNRDNIKLEQITHTLTDSFVGKIDEQINAKYIDESYFQKLKTQFETILKSDTDTPSDLEKINTTLTAWLNTMKIQEEVITETIKLVNDYLNTETRDFDTFKTEIQKIGFVKTASDGNVTTSSANSNMTDVSTNATDMNQFIPKMLLGLVYPVSKSTVTPTVTNNTTQPLKEPQSSENTGQTNNGKKKTRAEALQRVANNRQSNATTRLVKSSNGTNNNNGTTKIPVGDNRVQSDGEDTTQGIKYKGQVATETTSDEEIIERIINHMKNTITESIKEDKKTKIKTITDTLNETLTLINTPDTKPTLVKKKNTGRYISDNISFNEDDDDVDLQGDDGVGEQPTEIDAKPDYDKIKKNAEKIFNKNRTINEADIESKIEVATTALNKTSVNKESIKKQIDSAKQSIDAKITNANNEINETIQKAKTQIDDAIENAKKKVNKDIPNPNDESQDIKIEELEGGDI